LRVRVVARRPLPLRRAARLRSFDAIRGRSTIAVLSDDVTCLFSVRTSRLWRRQNHLWRGPAHDRDRGNAVLRAAFDETVAVRHIDQHVALLVEEAHDLQFLENQAAPFVEHVLTVLELALDLDRADLTAGDARVAGVLRHAQAALDAAGLRPAE